MYVNIFLKNIWNLLNLFINSDFHAGMNIFQDAHDHAFGRGHAAFGVRFPGAVQKYPRAGAGRVFGVISDDRAEFVFGILRHFLGGTEIGRDPRHINDLVIKF